MRLRTINHGGTLRRPLQAMDIDKAIYIRVFRWNTFEFVQTSTTFKIGGDKMKIYRRHWHRQMSALKLNSKTVQESPIMYKNVCASPSCWSLRFHHFKATYIIWLSVRGSHVWACAHDCHSHCHLAIYKWNMSEKSRINIRISSKLWCREWRMDDECLL